MTKDERIAALKEKLTPVGGISTRIWAKSEFVDFPVYRAPTERLILNPSNRRFRAEAQEVEEELGHVLDPLSSADDEESVISLLLDSDPHVEGSKVVGKQSKDTNALIVDWEKRDQESPLWIRPDGLVRNGNRRLAMLRRLAAARGEEGYDWVDVVVLDEEEYDDEAVFRIEAVEQLTEGFKVRYSDLNALLTLKDAAEELDIDWHDQESIEETARKIQDLVGNNANYAKIQLQAIKYMTAYLDWLGKPGQYHLLRRQVERFRDAGKNLAWVAKEDPGREADMLELCFRAISVAAKHDDLRQIRRMLKTDQDAFASLVEEVATVAEEETDEEEGEEIVEEVPAAETGDDEEEDEEDEEDTVPAGPLTPKQIRIKRAIDVGVQASKDAQDTDYVKHMRLAAGRLAKVDPAQVLTEISGAELEMLSETIDGIIKWAEAAQAALEQLKTSAE